MTNNGLVLTGDPRRVAGSRALMLAGKDGDKTSMLLTMRPESGLLNVDAMGEFSLKEAKRIFLEMLEAVALHKTMKVLFDGRKLIGKPDIMERFYYGEFAARAVWEF